LVLLVRALICCDGVLLRPIQIEAFEVQMLFKGKGEWEGVTIGCSKDSTCLGCELRMQLQGSGGCVHSFAFLFAVIIMVTIGKRYKEGSDRQLFQDPTFYYNMKKGIVVSWLNLLNWKPLCNLSMP
jgi:hypothetical protein